MMTKQPDYNTSSNKFYARKSNQDIYRHIRGISVIPENQYYQTLCHLQDLSPGSEIVQLTSINFLKPWQFIGVDNDENLIEQNRMYHPQAIWLPGDWVNVIRQQKNFNPAMVYLDTINELRSPIAARILCQTMWLCRPKTLIIANFCANNPRKGNSGGNIFEEGLLIRNMMKNEHPEFFKDWNKDKRTNHFRCVSYLYRTNKAWMRSYIFYKGSVNSTDLIDRLCA
jgi:hypothetical protein